MPKSHRGFRFPGHKPGRPHPALSRGEPLAGLCHLLLDHQWDRHPLESHALHSGPRATVTSLQTPPRGPNRKAACAPHPGPDDRAEGGPALCAVEPSQGGQRRYTGVRTDSSPLTSMFKSPLNYSATVQAELRGTSPTGQNTNHHSYPLQLPHHPPALRADTTRYLPPLPAMCHGSTTHSGAILQPGLLCAQADSNHLHSLAIFLSLCL